MSRIGVGRGAIVAVVALLVASAVGALAASGATRAVPNNTAQPTITGTAQVGEELTANNGTWTGNPTTFTYQWQRCNTDGTGCTAIDGATGKTYGVRTIDAGRSLRVVVTAKNDDGTASATADRTSAVKTSTTPTPTPTPTVNERPTITIINIRFVGQKIFVRVRACDDSNRNLTILARDARPGIGAYVRRFATFAPPRPCAALSRTWLPGPRFRAGRHVVTLTARDPSGKTSAPVRRTLVR
jgi:hypothetical protein